MIFFLIIISIEQFQAIRNIAITLGPLTQQSITYVIYQDEQLNQQFNSKETRWSNCSPLDLLYIKSNVNQQIAYTPLNIINTDDKDLIIDSLSLTTQKGQTLKITLNNTNNIVVQKKGVEIINIQYFCEKKLTKENYWAVIDINLKTSNQSLKFSYQYICDPNFHPKRFDWSYLILIVTMSTFVLFLARQQKLSAFKITYYDKLNNKNVVVFQGFHLGLKGAIIYNTVFAVGVTAAYVFEKTVEDLEENIVRCFCLIFGFILISELCYKMKFLKIRIVSILRACDIIGLLTTIITLHLYVDFNEPWIISNLLTIYLVGTSIKLFKITSLKNGLHFFIPCIIMDIVFSIYGSFFVRYEWDSLVMKYFNTPLTAQFPYFYPIYKKKCGWLSITSILFPAFFLAYAHRVDRFKDSIIYRLISYIGLQVGLTLWFTFSSLYSIPLPVSSFTLFPTIGISAIIAFQRNEIKVMWNGDFYDQVLLNPWRHQIQAGERESIHVLNKKSNDETELQNLADQEQQHQQTQLLRISRGQIKLHNELFQGLLD
ncbi:unnamed protein product [Paramecium octaurelia]|uniref:Transmembrane protein n=1 Tax=Paramecium octaurelia TaxID=43137 RepID=A0A8S1VAE0_PAROT|nr:unnamed protein product [Paramecium octaurelia]